MQSVFDYMFNLLHKKCWHYKHKYIEKHNYNYLLCTSESFWQLTLNILIAHRLNSFVISKILLNILGVASVWHVVIGHYTTSQCDVKHKV